MFHCLLLCVVTMSSAPDAAAPSARWETNIAKFEEQDRATPPPANPILFVGSSTIRIWDIARDFPGLKAINRGFGGSQYGDLVQYADRVIVKYAPSKIVLYSGDNDLASGKTPDQVVADIRALLDIIRRKLPQTRVFLIGIKPSASRWNLYDKQKETNASIGKLLKDPAYANVTFLDVMTVFLNAEGKPDPGLFKNDALHLNDAGYAKLVPLLKPLLEK